MSMPERLDSKQAVDEIVELLATDRIGYIEFGMIAEAIANIQVQFAPDDAAERLAYDREVIQRVAILLASLLSANIANDGGGAST